MAKIPYQDPLSNEVQSPLLAGTIEGLSKVSETVGMDTEVITDSPLAPIPGLDESDPYRIYQCLDGNRIWLSSPTPVIKLNGVVMSISQYHYSIDYIGGSITFIGDYRPSSSDNLTVSCNHVIKGSAFANKILADVDAKNQELEQKVNQDIDSINQSISNVNTQVSNIDSRVSNIIADGQQTEGNTELIDIREAFDGTQYYTAGDSVRNQSTMLSEMMGGYFSKNLYNKNGKTYSYGIYSVDLSVQDNSKQKMIFLDVEEGKTYTFSGYVQGYSICYTFTEKTSEIKVGSKASEKIFEGIKSIDSSDLSVRRGYATFTVKPGIKSIGIIYWRTGVDQKTEEEKRSFIQIEESESVTDYVPYGIKSEIIESIQKEIEDIKNQIYENPSYYKTRANYLYLNNIPLFSRKSNGFYSQEPTWVSRQYEIGALCVNGRYLYTGSHLGFKKWDISVESDPIDVTKDLSKNKYLQKNKFIEQWSINPWGTGGGIRTPYKMEVFENYIIAIVRGGSGFVEDSAEERNPNTNVADETETDGTVGYFIVMDFDLNVVYKEAYYGSSKTEVGYRKPSGFSIDKDNKIIYIGCQLYGWISYDISAPASPKQVYSYSPLDEDEITSINGADLSSDCGPIEYQNGCIFKHDDKTYYCVAGYVDGIHLWDVSDKSNPQEISNFTIKGTYGIFWAFRKVNPEWNNKAHLFDVYVDYPKMYATLAPTTQYGNLDNRISGLLVLDISDVSSPSYKYYPISPEDWNNYDSIGDVKPSHILVKKGKILLNNGNKGIAVYDNSESEPYYMGCIPSDEDNVYQMGVMDDGRFYCGCHTEPYNFRINRGI